jgi:dihydrofolate reductase
MRKIILSMMTTLNGRLDDPMEWMQGVDDEQYHEIDELYETYDTVLVGRKTYEEMAAYWPGALKSGEGTETNRRMAKRMNDYRKLVFTRSSIHELTPWNNVELVVAETDERLRGKLLELKAQPGKAIHLSGGASLAQAALVLGVVDELNFLVYPVVSPGPSWFQHFVDKQGFELIASKSYVNGVVKLHYRANFQTGGAKPERFTELLGQ